METVRDSRPSWLAPARPGRGSLVVAAAVLVWLALLSSRSTLWDRDEPRFARATLEMLRSGDLLVPRFDGAVRPDKPVLTYWLQAAAVKLLGRRELAFRLPSAFGAALACLLTAFAAARLAGARAGALAAAAMATTLPLAVWGSAATADCLLLAFAALAFATHADALDRGFGWGHAAAFSLAVGGGMLAKGPVVPAMAVAALVVTHALTWRRAPLTRGEVARQLAGLAAGFALFLLWAVPANQASGGVLLREGFGHHVVERALRPFEGHGVGLLAAPFYYPAVVLLGWFPWTLLLPAALARLWRERHGEEARVAALLAGWSLPLTAMMTLAATKLPHYVLPAWPAIAVALAGTVAGRENERLEPGIARSAGASGFAVAGAVLAAGALSAPRLMPLSGAARPLAGLAAVAAATVALGLWGVARWPRRRLVAILTGGGVALQAVLALAVVPALDRLKPYPPLARAIAAAVPLSVPVARVGDREPSLVFYLDRREPLVTLDTPEQAAAWLGERAPGVLVITGQELAVLERRTGPLKARRIAVASGLDVATGTHVELVALRRGSEGSHP